jgi:hypothetical protein
MSGLTLGTRDRGENHRCPSPVDRRGATYERGMRDKESYYEVEVTRDDGFQVDVQLDRGFQVVGSESDEE